MLLVSHDLDLAAEVCDRLLLLDGGRVACVGTPATVLEQSVLEPVFRLRGGRGSKSGERPTARACRLAVSARRREREVSEERSIDQGSRSEGSR